MNKKCKHENETLINEDVFLTLDDKQDTVTVLTFECRDCDKIGYREWTTPSAIEWTGLKDESK
jgi:hypothetical protein|tara:strand:+ start:267 stop:455 length:189 start_codon:yes stop_codon:yes gene_type:complete